MNPYMNYNSYNPQANSTDWESMARSWASYKSSSNIGNLGNGYSLMPFNPPPPPPPPPPPSIKPLMSIDVYNENQNKTFSNDQDLRKPESYIEQSTKVQSFDYSNDYSNDFANDYSNDYYNTQAYVNPNVYKDYKNTTNTYSNNYTNNKDHSELEKYENYQYDENCESNFDYSNSSIHSYETSKNYTSTFPNLDKSNEYSAAAKYNEPVFPKVSYDQPQYVEQPQKLFPVSDSYYSPESTNYSTYSLGTNNTVTSKLDGIQSKLNKSLPAWIIDDMKKIKEKEKKQTKPNVDLFKDSPTNVKRDEEGDIVMEDSESHDVPVFETGTVDLDDEENESVDGKPIAIDNTEGDIDDVSLNDDDETLERVDYASKSLSELVDLIDEGELENLKLLIIKDSLTGVMKEVTDNMIHETVCSCFNDFYAAAINSHYKDIDLVNDDECSGKEENVVKENGAVIDHKQREEPQPTVLGALLGLDAYESDNEDNTQESSSKNKSDTKDDYNETSNNSTYTQNSTNQSSSNRGKWCSHKKSSSKIDEKVNTSDKKSQNHHKEDNHNSSHSHHIRSRSRSRSRSRHRNKRSKKSRSRSRKQYGDKSSSSHKKSSHKKSSHSHKHDRSHSRDRSRHSKHKKSKSDKRHRSRS